MLQFSKAPKTEESLYRDPASVTLVLRVYYSNEIEELLEALAEETAARERPFEETALVVPNPRVADYVELELARLRGVCAHLRTRSLPELLSVATGEPFSEDRYLGPLLGALLDESFLSSIELAPIRDYLTDGSSRDAADRRRVQLARKVSTLFAGYHRHRPEILDCWRAGLYASDRTARSIESWQKRLWLEVAPRIASPPRTGASLPASLHLFGLSRAPRAEARALGRLAESADVFVYALNPCQEIWEALSEPLPLERSSTRRYERRGRELGPGEVYSFSNPFRLSNAGEMIPLRLWSRPGRESLRLLNAQTGCELVPRVHAPDGGSVLHRLQRDIVLRKPERIIPRTDAKAEDGSVVFMSCPSPRREVEAIAASIWELLAQDEARGAEVRADPLRLSDIAVLFAPSVAARYHALVETVFREMHGLPFQSFDLTPGRASSICQLVDSLLALPLTELAPGDVLRVLDHPFVAVRIPSAELREWMGYCERLGENRPSRGTRSWRAKVGGEPSSWERGLSCLAKDALSGHEPPGVESRRESATAFGVLVRSLLADARQAKRLHMTLPAWADFATALVRSYVEARSPEEERALEDCLAAVGRISEIDLAGRKINYRVAHGLVLRELDRVTDRRGRVFGDGVTVASLLPSRALPFKVVFVAGLNENAFPRRDPADPLNLGLAQRRAGDVTAPEEDRNLFLETLLSTRDKLFLSYVDRDELTGAERRPSSVFLELEETLRRSYLGAGPTRQRWPARRHEDPRTYRVSPGAARERAARRLGEHLETLVGPGGRAEAARRPGELPASVDALLGSVTLPPRFGRKRRDATVALSALRRFLECPLQGSVAFHFGMDAELERLFEPEGDGHRIRAQDGALFSGSEFRRGETRGASDEGSDLDAVERASHLDVLAAWHDLLQDVSTSIRLLPQGAPERLVLALGGSRIQLVREPALELASPRALLRLVSEPRGCFHPDRESLRGFLDHVFRCAFDPSYGAGRMLVLNAVPGEKGERHTFAFAPITQASAEGYLTSLLEELLSGVHDYVLPCERVFDSARGRDLRTTSSARGPVAHPEDFAPPSDEQARAIRERRFGLYFGSLVREEAS